MTASQNSARWRARTRKSGAGFVHVRLSAEAMKALDRLAAKYGGKTGAINYCLCLVDAKESSTASPSGAPE